MASLAKNNLKIKINVKRSKIGATESAKPFLTRDVQGGAVKAGDEQGGDVKRSKGTETKSICGTKRGPEGIIDGRAGKRSKMDRTVVRKCLLILNKLMAHPYGPGFSEPVDPVALNIPDYFTVISRPMDLGTIKVKLEKDMYAATSQFEADIRLTFSNAKKYNPPGNPFHHMAEELNSLFNKQWRFVVSGIEREGVKGKADTGLSDGGKKDASRISTMLPMKTKETPTGQKNPLTRKETSTGQKNPSSSGRTNDLKAHHKPLKKCDSQPTSRGWKSPVCEPQLSPRAMRAEMLKRRFADTIWKAQKNTLLFPGERCGQVKREVEKQRLERQHAEEKLKTEGEVKASLAGHRSDRRILQCQRERESSQRSDCRVQYQREREASRRALEKMKQTVEFEDNIAILRDLAYMIGDSSFAGPLRGLGGMYVAANQFVNGKLQSPLERLGLYLKEDDDCMSGDDVQGHDSDYEEGELIF